MFCTNCGLQWTPDVQFCSKCGKAFNIEKSVVVPDKEEYHNKPDIQKEGKEHKAVKAENKLGLARRLGMVMLSIAAMGLAFLIFYFANDGNNQEDMAAIDDVLRVHQTVAEHIVTDSETEVQFVNNELLLRGEFNGRAD